MSTPTLAVDAPPGPASALDLLTEFQTGVRRFELRLYRALLIARALLPVATLAVILSATLDGQAGRAATIVWVVLALWTAGTTPWLWSRFEWARRMPVPVWLEISALVALVLVGLGTRPWHLLHCFVPLVFVGLFVSEKAARLTAVAIVAALWAGHALVLAWPDAPIERPDRAVVPSALLLVTAVLLVYVRRLLRDVDAIAADEKIVAADTERARQALVQQQELSSVYREVARELAVPSAQIVELGGALASTGSGAPELLELPARDRRHDRGARRRRRRHQAGDLTAGTPRAWR